MAQAKKKKQGHLKGSPFRPGRWLKGVSGSLGMLLIGMVVGSLITTLWNGWRRGGSEIGSGIQRMMEASSTRSTEGSSAESPATVQSEPQKIHYEFFTVLPEMEMVVSESDRPTPEEALDESGTAEPDSSKPTAVTVAAIEPTPTETGAVTRTPTASAKQPQTPVRTVRQTPAGSYMLQAGSFTRPAQADQQKAKIALLGLSANIQKVTIQGRGDFYRVRLGPFSDYGHMERASQRLDQENIQSIRLKVLRPDRNN